MLIWRLILGAFFIAALVGLCWLDYFIGSPEGWDSLPGMILLWLALLLAVLATRELLQMFKERVPAPSAWVGLVINSNLLIVGSCVLSFVWPLTGEVYPIDFPLAKLGWPLIALAVAMLLTFTYELWWYEKPGQTLPRLSLSIFALVYVGVLLSFTVQLRLFGDNQTGMVALASLVAVVKASDTGAYTFGRLFGRHKLAPVVSPGKTVEGTIGGLATAVAVSVGVFGLAIPAWLGMSGGSLWGWLAYGLILGIVGTLGDLAESLLKRDAGVKDSSPWMPGFGGILDLVDSILLAAPVAYVCWAVGLVKL